jgi:hypothetical protein
MKTLWLIAGGVALAAAAAPRGRLPELTQHMALSVHWVDPGDIHAVALEHGQELEHGRTGFAVLHGREGGPWTCDLYVRRPISLATVHTQALVGHELLHCIYGNYHE